MEPRQALCLDQAIMKTQTSILDAIGDTPLIRLHGPSEETGCEILGKAEFLNPGGSVKDRAALGIIRAAEADGRLGPGGVIVEGTAGNTGIGLAMVADALGYRTVIVMPNTQSQEKVDTLKTYGAELALIPAAPYRNPNHFVHVARRYAEEIGYLRPSDSPEHAERVLRVIRLACEPITQR